MSQNQVFKPDRRKQTLLFPSSLEELISADHPVRFIDEFVEEIDIGDLLSSYKGGGASAYHPRMLLKLLVYGYLDRTYSSRVLEKQCKENICYMWLLGGQEPDHNTIANFRSKRLKDDIKTIFKQAIRKAYELGIIQLKTQMVDGTILESVANRYSYVWSKNIERFKGGLEEKIAALLSEIDSVLDQEDSATSSEDVSCNQEDLPNDKNSEDASSDEETLADGDTSAADSSSTAINSEELLKIITDLEQLDNDQVQKRIKQLKAKHLPKLSEYERHQALLNGRSSYSKTDPDATFMRMKEDQKKKSGQPRPAYNWMISSENQFILNYTIHQNPNDGTCYQSHTNDTLELLEGEGLPSFVRSMGDSVFGTEENYEYLAKKGIDSYLKYPSFHSDQKKKVQENPFLGQNFYYNATLDFMVCPMGQRLYPIETRILKKKSGYECKSTIYQAQNCQGCPLRSLCQPSKKESPISNRTVSLNPNLEKHKKQAHKNLNSLQGIRLRSKRSVDVEPPFGNIKHNQRFKRLTLKSIPKINIEVGLLCLAHNLKKIWKWILKDRIAMPDPIKNPPKSGKYQRNAFFNAFFALFYTTAFVRHHTTKKAAI